MTTVGDLGERQVVSRIRQILGAVPDGYVGAGDDAAVVPVDAGSNVVVSTDRVPTDLIALQLGLMSHSELGRYLVDVNVSDLVAMGAKPIGFLLNLALPPSFGVTELDELVTGVAERGRELGAFVVGGDCKEADTPQYVGVALGSVLPDEFVTRSGAALGDRVYVTGVVGGHGAALAYFCRQEQGPELPAAQVKELHECLVRPKARTDLTQYLYSTCTSCIDVSDGLGDSLRELGRESQQSFEVDADLIPLHPMVVEVSELIQVDPLEIAFGIGLDLQLLYTANGPTYVPDSTAIGSVIEQSAGHRLQAHGRTVPIPGRGYQHLVKDATDFVVR
jgi:thiamine-monophosphate kinase